MFLVSRVRIVFPDIARHETRNCDSAPRAAEVLMNKAGYAAAFVGSAGCAWLLLSR